MKISRTSLKNAFVETIALLYVLLFVYAAVSKLMDFEIFQIQIAQSPLLSSFAGPISYMVIGVELLIALLLSIRRTRVFAFCASYSLMIMFTAYIIIILNFSPFVPCSCGGILEKLNWNQHLIFNIVFCILGLMAILFHNSFTPSVLEKKLPILRLLLLTVLSIGAITGLYLSSEDMFHHRNNFTRRFPVHPAEFLYDYPLTAISPYIAGVDKDKVFISDKRDPLKIIEINIRSKKELIHRITTNEPERRFRALRAYIQPPYFYLSDGLEAFALIGTITDWKATLWIDQLAYYNAFVPLDAQRAAIRALDGKKNENIIGVMHRGDSTRVDFNPSLLDKQIDGVFDTDGKLLFNQKHQRLIYVYTYRNQYLLTDPELKSKVIGHTIDTTTKARIKVAYVKNQHISKIASPGWVVNKNATTEGDYLYVHSKLLGQFEHKDTWAQSSVIDVYNIMERTYLFSFYLYDKKGHKISEFVIDGGHAYTIAGTTLTVYHMDPIPFENNK